MLWSKMCGQSSHFDCFLLLPYTETNFIFILQEQNHKTIVQCSQTQQLPDFSLLGKKNLHSKIYLSFILKFIPLIPGCAMK